MYVIIGVIVLFILVLVYELRFRRPDQIVLYERRGKIITRKYRIYPRHLSLTVHATSEILLLNIDASAKGNLDVRVKLAITAVPFIENISTLIKVGGWSIDCVSKAYKKLEILIHGFVKEFTEKYEIEELSSEKIYEYLNKKIVVSKELFGLDVISLVVQSFEPVDLKIIDALRQQESARILEQTEKLNQKARISAAKAKIEADGEIALIENDLELKKYDLKKIEQEKESSLASKRVEDELVRDRMRLEYEKEELSLLKNSPELLLLTPQAARLAEASQTLKNAKTIISLSQNDVTQGSELLGLFQKFIKDLLSGSSKKVEGKK
jgi:hypothetical protein